MAQVDPQSGLRSGELQRADGAKEAFRGELGYVNRLLDSGLRVARPTYSMSVKPLQNGQEGQQS